jgi:hypothetical protein
MKRRPWQGLIVAGGLACLGFAGVEARAGDKAAPGKKSDGWVQLFNGKDLAGWKTHSKNPGQWQVKDGIL